MSERRRVENINRLRSRLSELNQIEADLLEEFMPDRCWCGTKHPYFAPIDRGCGGTGIIDCHCGGDQCVCHWHGEIECDGCEDCRESGYDEEYRE